MIYKVTVEEFHTVNNSNIFANMWKKRVKGNGTQINEFNDN